MVDNKVIFGDNSNVESDDGVDSFGVSGGMDTEGLWEDDSDDFDGLDEDFGDDFAEGEDEGLEERGSDEVDADDIRGTDGSSDEDGLYSEGNEVLLAEYESIYDDTEKLLHKLVAVKGKISLSYTEVSIDEIIQSQLKKQSRGKTLIGLSEIVAEWGVVTPIHVMRLESDGNYLLLDGLRRVYAAVRAGIKKIPAILWSFEDITAGKELASIISLVINRCQVYSNSELWTLFQFLDGKGTLSFGLIEFLLQLKAGEAMKLKDVMTSDEQYEDLRVMFLSDDLTIEGAYKKLCNLRKKENALEKEEMTSLSGEDSDINLSKDEVLEILDMDEGVDIDNLEEMDMTADVLGDSIYQETGDRRPLPKELRMVVLERDNYTCQCCKKIGGAKELAIIAIHHIIPVFAKGPDLLKNLVTLCVNCHILVHNYIEGKLVVDLDSLDEEEKEKFKNIFTFGNKAIKAIKKLGWKREDMLKASAGSTRHPYPSEFLAANKAAAETNKFHKQLAEEVQEVRSGSEG